MASTTPQRVLVSVSDKSELAPFVQGLVERGFEVISTGGTRRHLEEANIPVIDISAYTNFPEIMDGRVKTLHPKVHGAILGRTDLAADQEAMQQHEIIPFQLVVCNLYPFEKTVAKADVSIPQAIEQIDIGGPSMVRSAAKNHKYVGIVTNPSQYREILTAMDDGQFDETMRRKLAAAAFEMTALYDRAIANYMAGITADKSDTENSSTQLPANLALNYQLKSQLRYGENPHQSAAFYVEPSPHPATLANAEQLHGKELSYNNLLDLDAAFTIARGFSEPAAAVLKHNNPCGCAIADTLSVAFDKAYAGDPVSAFGSIISFNRNVDVATADLLCEPNRFVEAIIAPDFDEQAFEILTTRPKWKNNVRLLRCPELMNDRPTSYEYRKVSGGLLVQECDEQLDNPDDWKCVTERQPTADELRDLKFVWTVSKFVKSNAIVFAREGAVVGVGAGQMSRLDSAFIAAHKAGDRSQGGVVGSDAFFPFRDGVDQVAAAGITAVIQPGGSRRDDEVIAACNEHGMTMLFTGHRHFKH